jgi:hypothetical protein
LFFSGTPAGLGDAEVFDTRIVESLVRRAFTRKRASCSGLDTAAESIFSVPVVDEKPASSGPDWSTIIEKVSSLQVEESEEAEHLALTYFMQWRREIRFQECIICGGKTFQSAEMDAVASDSSLKNRVAQCRAK